MNCLEKMKLIVEKKGNEADVYQSINEFLDKYPECAYEWTLQEVSEIFGLSKERIRQMELAALRKMKNPKIGPELLKALRDYLS